MNLLMTFVVYLFLHCIEDEKHKLGFSPDIDSLVTSEELNNARTYEQISVSDVLCSACKELLFRPVVLNCGHGTSV